MTSQNDTPRTAAPMGGRGRSREVLARRALRRGFTLIELMIVVIVVALLAAAAIPAMITARDNQLVYEAAGRIAQIARSARTRSIGRGAAMLLTLSASDTSADRGSAYLYEARDTTKVNLTTQVAPPLGSCRNAVWALNGAAGPNATMPTSAYQVDGLTFNSITGGVYQNASITGKLSYSTTDGTNTTTVTTTSISLCFSPSGRLYYVTPSANLVNFEGVSPMMGTVYLAFSRRDASNTPIGITQMMQLSSTGAVRVLSNNY